MNAAIDLTTLAAVKAYAELDPTKPSKDDKVIARLITAFGQMVLNKTGLASFIGVSTYTEVYDGNGSFRMFLRNRPILSVTSLKINGVSRTASAGYGSAGYYIEATKKSIAIRTGSTGDFTSGGFSVPGYPFIFAKGLGNIEVGYTAGFPTRTATNELQTIVGGTTTLDYPNWFADGAVVFYPSMTPLVKVGSVPTAGQYAVTNGIYSFNVADENKAIMVTYDFNAPPDDLIDAATQAVAIKYKRRQTIDQASKTIGSGNGVTGTVSFRSWALPPEIVQVLENYTRAAVV